MSRKLVLTMSLTIVLMGMLGVALNVQKVEASGTIYIRADGSVDPPSAPISNVDNVTYTFMWNIYDEIVIQRNNIILDGNGYTLQGTGALDSKGISLSGRSNITIKNVRINAFSYGINITGSSGNSIFGNHITNCSAGLWLYGSSSYNSIYGNNITANKGYGVYLIYSSNYNSIFGNNITANNWPSISVLESSNNTISGNNITANNHDGIWLVGSSNNTIYGNNIKNNSRGISLYSSSNNTFYHNNFIDNTPQVFIDTPSYANFWDNGVEGNYWSNYTGIDSDHDGIGDTAHVLDGNNTDNYPLMGMFHSFNASLGYYVNVISNSTIENFHYFETNSTIKMYVSNMTANQTFGFCRVSIPKDLMPPPYTVIINDGSTEVLYFNDTIHDNNTHRWIYFAYQHSTHKVVIIPEFPTWTSMLLIFIVLTVAIVIYKRRLLKTPIH